MEEEEERGQVDYVGELVGISSLLFGGMTDLLGKGGMGYGMMESKIVEGAVWPRKGKKGVEYELEKGQGVME